MYSGNQSEKRIRFTR